MFTAPVSGIYTITAAGAEGGTGGLGQNPFYPVTAGAGAVVSGDVYLASGAVLYIVPGAVGGSNFNSGGGGGGGSFVFTSLTSPLLVAGGGGGSPYCANLACQFGGPGTIGAPGSGLGGAAGSSAFGGDGAGGGGWLGAGSAPPPKYDPFGDPFFDFLTGGAGPPSFAGGATYSTSSVIDFGSAPGGYGGGGAGGYFGGGGGGGYTGGDGGGDFLSTGGTSYFASILTNTSGIAGDNQAFGYVNIRDGALSVTFALPEPAAWTLMLVGFGGIGARLRHSRGRRAIV